MAKNFAKNAEDRSMFLVQSSAAADTTRKGERMDTSPFRSARMININRIQPDSEQPRKTFEQDSLESLAESIKELGGIIDPLTVEFVEKKDVFQIISGERRYRAAKIAGLETLPCIVKDVDEHKRFLMQFIANLQREDIPPLEEAAGIRHIVQKMGYTQQKIAKLLNKSKSYVSQILGLERLSESAMKKVQMSELSKEVLIQASKESDPNKQVEILKSASDGEKTIRQIRNELNGPGQKKSMLNAGSKEKKEKGPTASQPNTFKEWTWEPNNKKFVVTIRFGRKQNQNEQTVLIRKSLEEALMHVQILPERTWISNS